MPWYLIVVTALAGAAVAGYAIFRVSRLFGKAEGLIKEIKDADDRERETPKSLNAMDGLLLPQLLRDFPEYNRAVLTDRVIKDTRLFYESALKGELLYDDGITESLRENIVLPTDVAGGIVVHRVALAAYDRSGRGRTITYQSSVQYDADDGRHRQKRLVLKYLAAHAEDFTENILVIKCPNCSAPVSTVGEKVCPYCGAALVTPAGYRWVLIDVREG